MFRWKFLMAAVVAAIAAIPGSAKAGYTVTFDVYDSGGTTLLSSSGPFTSVTTFFAIGPTSLGQGVALEAFTANFSSNLPTSQSLTNTSVKLTNSDATANRVVITVEWDGFTIGSTGAELLFRTDADANSNSPPGLSNATGVVRTVVNDGGLTEDYAGSPSSPGGVAIPLLPSDGSNVGNLTSFTRSGSSTFEVTQYIYLDMGANSSASFSSTSQVMVPAPAGLILAATALPFVGLLRRRLRRPETTTAA